MRRLALFCILVAVFVSGLAFADEDLLVMSVEKPLAADVLRQAGVRYLADLGHSYLVDGDGPAAKRLSALGADFRTIVSARPGDEIFLLRPRNLGDELLYGSALFKVADGLYIAALQRNQIDDLKLLPFSKTRLVAGAFPEPSAAKAELVSMAITPKPQIENLVAAVSSDTISKYISQMSGREGVVIGGVLDTLKTRYSYSTDFPNACQYVYERFQDYGIPVELQEYTISIFDFYATYFCNDRIGWVAGSDQKVFKTTDGGSSWVRQSPAASNQTFFGACFVDTVTGWLAGSSGTIRRTLNGGTSWGTQSSGTSSTLREIFMLDYQNGWVVGYGGTIRRTTNGGTNWTAVTSGTSGDLYGCHFRSNSRGWASGTGEMRFWDGSSWTAQTVGTTENLLDVYFVNDNVGWTVGGGATILKTVDGGQNWVVQTAPAGCDPFFKGVCFADSLEGWVVGLSGTVIHTTDSGESWEIQPSGTLFGLRWVDFVDNDTGWAVGYGGTILHTDDGGATWVNQRSNLPSANIRVLNNVVATKPGTVSSEQVMICGHLDDTSPDPYNLAPGADDNASGTAAAIEAARVVASTSFKRTIKFCAWSGEEQGLYGSGEYAAQARSAGDVINGVLNFDMIGYVNVAPEDIDVIGNDASEWLVDLTIDCANAYVPGLATLKLIDPTVSGSDHYMFWHAGYDALLCIEDDNVPYPFYHTIYDTLGNITMPFCTDVIKMGIAALAELAEVDTTASIPTLPWIDFAVSAHPNPSSTGAGISFALPSAGSVEAGVYDAGGRLVRSLFQGSLPAGRHDLAWLGDDADGRSVSAGIYFAKIRTAVGEGSTKVVVLR